MIPEIKFSDATTVLCIFFLLFLVLSMVINFLELKNVKSLFSLLDKWNTADRYKQLKSERLTLLDELLPALQSSEKFQFSIKELIAMEKPIPIEIIPEEMCLKITQ